MINIQLRRPSDGHTSEPRPFQLLPREVDPEGLARKRQKIEESCLDRYLRDNIMTSNIAHSSAPSTSQIDASITSTQSQACTNELVDPLFSNNKEKLQSLVRPGLSNWPRTSAASSVISGPTAPTTESVIDMVSHLYAASNLHLVNATPDPNCNINLPNDESFPKNLNTKAELISEAMKQIIKNSDLCIPYQHSINSLVSNSEHTLNNANFANNANNANNNVIVGNLSEKLDSLDLDIDPNDLMNDINFNNMMVLMDSGNNITFNSSGNINIDNATIASFQSNVTTGQLNNLNINEINDNGKNILFSSPPMSISQNELMINNHSCEGTGLL